MADYIVKDTELTSVANAIRTAGGTNNSLTFPNGFVSAVENIGGGGGGSSDFSTASVTINGVIASLDGAFIAPYDYFETDTSIFRVEDDNTTHTLILYKGKALIFLDARGNVSTSGSIELIENDIYFVTGDCTITIT